MLDHEQTSIKRVVGKGLSEEQKSGIRSKYQEKFLNQDRVLETLSPGTSEVTKTPTELEIIHLANSYTNELLARMDLPEIDIPDDNVHIVSETADIEAIAYYPHFQAIIARREIANIRMAEILFHEIIHFKSYNAVQYIPEVDGMYDYRVGLDVHSRLSDFSFFKELNEAVTEELSMEFILRYKNHPLFKHELADIENERKKMANQFQPDGIPYLEKDSDPLFLPFVEKDEKGEIQLMFGNLGYNRERKSFNNLVEKLFNFNPDKFTTKKQVLNMFFRGMMTGRIYTIGKMIDETFGVGAFRAIGVAQTDEEFADVIGSL